MQIQGSPKTSKSSFYYSGNVVFTSRTCQNLTGRSSRAPRRGSPGSGPGTPGGPFWVALPHFFQPYFVRLQFAMSFLDVFGLSRANSGTKRMPERPGEASRDDFRLIWDRFFNGFSRILNVKGRLAAQRAKPLFLPTGAVLRRVHTLCGKLEI